MSFFGAERMILHRGEKMRIPNIARDGAALKLGSYACRVAVAYKRVNQDSGHDSLDISDKIIMGNSRSCNELGHSESSMTLSCESTTRGNAAATDFLA
jgi:hypothetical protein